MRFNFHLFVFAALTAASVSAAAQAGIYTFTDSHGVVHFTNKPTDPRYSSMTRVAYLPERDASVSVVRRIDQERYRSLVEKAAREHQVDQALLRAIISVESGYDAEAISSRGAVGLMQVMPQTARRYGITNVHDPAQNIQAGTRYLRDLLNKFNNNLALSLAAYNAGEGAIQRYGNRIPPYQETLAYVPKVIDIYNRNRRSTPK